MHAKVSGRGFLSTTWSTTPMGCGSRFADHLVGLVLPQRSFPLFGVALEETSSTSPFLVGRPGTALAVRVTAARERVIENMAVPELRRDVHEL